MKKNWIAMLMLLALAAPILYAVTARQLYRVDYDATRDGNTYTWVDRMALGVSTATGKQYIIQYGTGSTIWKGFDTSVEITTAGIKINGLSVSSGSAADYDLVYLRISSGIVIEALIKDRLSASTGPVIEALNDKINQSVKTTDSPSFASLTVDSATVNGITRGQRFMAYEGGGASSPSFSWAHSENSGMFLDDAIIRWAVGGYVYASLNSSNLYIGTRIRGTCAAGLPGLSFTTDSRTGLCGMNPGYLWVIADGVTIATVTPRGGSYGIDSGTYTINCGGIFKNGADLSLDSFPILFTSTDTAAGCGVCPSTVTYRLPTAWTLTASRIFANDITGSVTIVVSTGDTVAGTWVVISSGDAMSATTQYFSGLEHWVGSKTIPAGKLIRFYVGGTPSATQSATYQLDFKR